MYGFLSKAAYLKIVAKLGRMGARGVVLGCTEIGSLLGQSDTEMPLFDTTKIHAAAAVEWALK
jgi:aspartate racemase